MVDGNIHLAEHSYSVSEEQLSAKYLFRLFSIQKCKKSGDLVFHLEGNFSSIVTVIKADCEPDQPQNQPSLSLVNPEFGSLASLLKPISDALKLPE